MLFYTSQPLPLTWFSSCLSPFLSVELLFSGAHSESISVWPSLPLTHSGALTTSPHAIPMPTLPAQPPPANCYRHCWVKVIILFCNPNQNVISLRAVTLFHPFSCISLNCNLDLIKVFSFCKMMHTILYTYSEGNDNCRINLGRLFGMYLAYLFTYVKHLLQANQCQALYQVFAIEGKIPWGGQNGLNESSVLYELGL